MCRWSVKRFNFEEKPKKHSHGRTERQEGIVEPSAVPEAPHCCCIFLIKNHFKKVFVIILGKLKIHVILQYIDRLQKRENCLKKKTYIKTHQSAYDTFSSYAISTKTLGKISCNAFNKAFLRYNSQEDHSCKS